MVLFPLGQRRRQEIPAASARQQLTLVFLFQGSRSKQMATLQSRSPLKVPSQRGFFPSHCHVMLEGRFKDGPLFPLIVPRDPF